MICNKYDGYVIQLHGFLFSLVGFHLPFNYVEVNLLNHLLIAPFTTAFDELGLHQGILVLAWILDRCVDHNSSYISLNLNALMLIRRGPRSDNSQGVYQDVWGLLKECEILQRSVILGYSPQQGGSCQTMYHRAWVTLLVSMHVL